MIKLRIILGTSLCLLMLTGQLAMAQPLFILAGDSLSDSLCHHPMIIDDLLGDSIDFDEDGNWDVRFDDYTIVDWDITDIVHFGVPATDVEMAVIASGTPRLNAFNAGSLISPSNAWNGPAYLELLHRWEYVSGGSGQIGSWSMGTVAYCGVRISHAPNTTYCWGLVEMTTDYSLRLLGKACRCDSTAIGIEDAADASPLFWHLQDDQLFIGGLTGSNAQVEICDMLGRRVLSVHDGISHPTGRWSMDVSHLPLGQYLAKVTDNQGMRSLLWMRH